MSKQQLWFTKRFLFNIYNLIASVYSSENYKVVEKIISANATNNIFYYDSEKIKSWLSVIGQLQLLPNITANSFYSEKDFSNDANIEKDFDIQAKNEKSSSDQSAQLSGTDEHRFDFGDKFKNIKVLGYPAYQFAEALADRYNMGEKFDWAKAKKMAVLFKIGSEQEVMQACELAVVLQARNIAQNGQSIAQRYAALLDLYDQQITIRPLDTQGKILQQYSTPCPLAFLLGTFV